MAPLPDPPFAAREMVGSSGVGAYVIVYVAALATKEAWVAFEMVRFAGT